LTCVSTYKGHTIGEVVITALTVDDDVDDDDPNHPMERFTGTLTMPFKNENLYAEHTTDDAITTVRGCSFTPESVLKVPTWRWLQLFPILSPCLMLKMGLLSARLSTNMGYGFSCSGSPRLPSGPVLNVALLSEARVGLGLYRDYSHGAIRHN